MIYSFNTQTVVRRAAAAIVAAGIGVTVAGTAHAAIVNVGAGNTRTVASGNSLNVTGGSSTIRGTLDVQGTIKVNPTMSIRDNGVMAVTGTARIDGGLRVRDDGIVTNDGAFVGIHDAAGISVEDRGRFTNNGSISDLTFVVSGSGSLINTVTGDLDVPTGMTVRGSGTFVNDGTSLIKGDGFYAESNAVVTNNGTMTFDNDWATANGSAILNNNGTLNIDEILHISDNAVLNNNGTLVNDGELSFSTGSDVTLGGTIVNNGDLSASDMLNVTGALSGSGSIRADAIVLAGGVNAGNSPGLLTLEGDTTFASVSTLTLEINGFGRGIGFDAYNIEGDLIIEAGATLLVDLLDSFAPTIGDRFDFAQISEGSITGAFTNVSDGWQVLTESNEDTASLILEYTGNVGSGTSLPEASSLAFAGLGLAGLAGAALRRRRIAA